MTGAGPRVRSSLNPSCSPSAPSNEGKSAAKNRLGAILDEAQREPIVIQRQERDIAVVISMAEYERLRLGNVQAFLDLRNELAAPAAANGLTDERLAEILTSDEA